MLELVVKKYFGKLSIPYWLKITTLLRCMFWFILRQKCRLKKSSRRKLKIVLDWSCKTPKTCTLSICLRRSISSASYTGKLLGICKCASMLWIWCHVTSSLTLRELGSPTWWSTCTSLAKSIRTLIIPLWAMICWRRYSQERFSTIIKQQLVRWDSRWSSTIINCWFCFIKSVGSSQVRSLPTRAGLEAMLTSYGNLVTRLKPSIHLVALKSFLILIMKEASKESSVTKERKSGRTSCSASPSSGLRRSTSSSLISGRRSSMIKMCQKIRN